MMSAIDSLWNGDITFCENCGAGDPEIETLVTLMEESKEALQKELSREHLVIFARYEKWADQFAQLMSAAAFREGFSFAAKLLTQALQE